jgi:hypothetical protein
MEKILHFAHDIRGRRGNKLQHQCDALANGTGFNKVETDVVNLLFTQGSTVNSTIAAT